MIQLTRIALATLFALRIASLAQAASIDGDPVYRGDPNLAAVARVLLSPSPRSHSTEPHFRTREGQPELDIRLEKLDHTILNALRQGGLNVLHADFENARVFGTCPGDCLPALAALKEVTAVHPNYGAAASVGNALSQADNSIRADLARQEFAVDGSGVRIGMISDTFSSRAPGTFGGEGCGRTYQSFRFNAAAELPEFVNVIAEPRDLEGAEPPLPSSDEGRAMAELIHDLAPGADLSFYTAFTSPSIFARAIDELVSCEADIIVDDVIYFVEPMFQDGIIAQAAGRAIDSGVMFFSAIGNLGTWGADQNFTDFSNRDDTESPPTGDDYHLFSNGSRFAPITIPPFCGLRMILQWNEPFSGALGPGPRSDLDLYVCPDDNPLVNCSLGDGGRDAQGCSTTRGNRGDPIEIVDYDNRDNAAQTVYLAVDHVCGDKNLRFRIVSFARFCNFPSTYVWDEEVFRHSQAYGHPVAPGVISTAASFYREIDTQGTEQGDPKEINVEPFSSLGGEIPYYFDGQGDPLENAPRLVTSPLLTAPDGTNTSFFGLPDVDNDGFRNFFGTSAAAPHAAAVAALMFEADPDLGAIEALGILQGTSIDIESPGFDTLSGPGLIDARDAVEEVLRRKTSRPTPTATPTPTESETLTPTSIATSSATATLTASVPSTNTATPKITPTCTGDCNGDGRVSVAELVTSVGISLGRGAIESCPSIDANADGVVRISELILAVQSSLRGCSA